MLLRGVTGASVIGHECYTVPDSVFFLDINAFKSHGMKPVNVIVVMIVGERHRDGRNGDLH